jgi:DNA-binding NarL/FixJ family response regulator
MTQLLNSPAHWMLVVEPDGVVRSTVASVVRELELAQVHQAASVPLGTQVLSESAVDALVLSVADTDAALELLTRLRAGEFASKSDIPVVVLAPTCDGALALRLKQLEVRRLLLTPFRIRDVVQTLEALVLEPAPALGASPAQS